MSSKLPALHGRVLLEGHNLTLASGTGIATYARQLAASLRGMGLETGLLVGSPRYLDPKDPVLSEVILFDAALPPSFARSFQEEWRKLTIGPFPAKAIAVPRLGTVVNAASKTFRDYSELLVVPHLLEREVSFFRRYGRRLVVAPPRTPDLFHATRPAPIRVDGCPNIYTLHDIVPLRLPYTTLDDKKLYLNMIRDLCRDADHIVTVSEFSRRDIIELTGISEDRITNTYQAVSLPERLLVRDDATVDRELDALFGLRRGEYFLFVGALEPKKNVSRLIDAFAASGVDRPLVIAGGDGWMNGRDIEKMNQERFLSYRMEGQRIRPERAVRRLSYLPFDHLVSLIGGARALLFPSVYEGFGLPVLEAMLLGTPVMTSNVSSLPEIAGDAALLVDPYDIDAMGTAIRSLDADADLRKGLAERGRVQAQRFSPERYQQRLHAVYSRFLG